VRLQRTALRNTVCIPDVPEVDRKGMLDPKMKCIITSWRAASDPVTLFEPHYKRATPHRRSRCKAFPTENMICTDGKDAVFYRTYPFWTTNLGIWPFFRHLFFFFIKKV